MPTRKFRGYDVEDAKTPLTIVPTNDHLAAGVPLDGSSCAIARFAHDALASPAVNIGATVALIVQPDSRGALKAMRYEITPGARRIIEENDAAKRGPLTRRAVTLKPPRPANRLANKRTRIRDWRAKPKAPAKTDGRGRNGGGAARKRIPVVRNYSGRLYA